MLSFALAACSTGGGSLPVPPADYYDDYAEALCLLEIRCGVWQDEATCETNIKGALGFAELGAQLVSDVASGKILFDKTNAGICVDSIAAASCDVDLVASPDQAPAACNNIISGTIQTDGFCVNSSECETGTCNINLSSCQNTACCVGTCAAPLQPSAIGGPCGDELHTCDPSAAYCNMNTCTMLIADGTACTATAQCLPSSTCTMEMCTPLPPLGQMCDTTDGCLGLGVACNPADMMCETMVGAGQSCASNPCKLDSNCDAVTMLCETTTAPMLSANGASCTGSGATCTSGYCDTSTMECAPPAACTL